MITVIYKGSLSQQRKPAASMGDARRLALDLVAQIGPDAWQHTIVQDSHGTEHRPAELWGEISLKP